MYASGMRPFASAYSSARPCEASPQLPVFTVQVPLPTSITVNTRHWPQKKQTYGHITGSSNLSGAIDVEIWFEAASISVLEHYLRHRTNYI